MLGGFFGRKAPQLVDRDGERYDVSLRVLSRELPGYRGVTLDLSRSGVQLETSGLLTIGSEPTLKFEFDRGELESFECPARVVWSRQEDSGARKFHSGLTFVPSTDDEKRQLSRMATVLQTRSETDLNTLLDQALRIDPELERSYANLSTNNYSQYSANEPAPPKPAATVTSASASTERKPSAADSEGPAPHPGVYMPLSVTLEGYTWNRASKTLHLGIREGDEVHSLYFPNCQLFQVMEPASDETIVGLYSTATSPATRRLELGTQIEYKHYRFVAEGGKGLVDIVSEGCRPRV